MKKKRSAEKKGKEGVGAPGNQPLPDQFQTASPMLVPDWAQNTKDFVSNQRAVSFKDQNDPQKENSLLVSFSGSASIFLDRIFLLPKKYLFVYHLSLVVTETFPCVVNFFLARARQVCRAACTCYAPSKSNSICSPESNH